MRGEELRDSSTLNRIIRVQRGPSIQSEAHQREDMVRPRFGTVKSRVQIPRPLSILNCPGFDGG